MLVFANFQIKHSARVVKIRRLNDDIGKTREGWQLTTVYNVEAPK